MEIRPIRTEANYEKALQRIDELIDCKENSKEEEELEVISLLVWDYEEKYILLDIFVGGDTNEGKSCF